MILNQESKSIENDESEFQLEEIEEALSKQLVDSFADLELLEKDKKMISNPDSLGEVVMDEVWKQFGNQIGLDVTNETLIQQYDRENPEDYRTVGSKVMKDKRYKEANKAMKEQKDAGVLIDEYTGKKLGAKDTANLDHVVSRKELYENQRRKQANLSVEELANKPENLKATNESLNKSKGAKSNTEYIEKRKTRERDLIKQNERANKKIDQSNMSDFEKKQAKEKINKRLEDKLAANDKLMKNAEKEAEKSINRDIRSSAAKEVGKKAGKDALKVIALSALSALLKEIVAGLVRFFKEKSKSFKGFLNEMKQSIKRFFSKILNSIQSGASSFLGTIISEIFGPIVSTFKRLASLIKQGVSSVIDAVKFLRDPTNHNKPFSVKIAQVGKIVTAGIVGGGAIFLGEAFEKFLLTVPGMQTPIPLMGTLANIIGLFLSSLVAGIIGAIILNLIDKLIAKQLTEETDLQIHIKKNEIIGVQEQQIFVAEYNLETSKDHTMKKIYENHSFAKKEMEKSLTNIFKGSSNTCNIMGNHNGIQDDLIQMQKELDELL